MLRSHYTMPIMLNCDALSDSPNHCNACANDQCPEAIFLSTETMQCMGTHKH